MSKVQGFCALTWFNGKKLTEQLLNVSLISFRSLQLRTSNKQWAKTLTGMKVPPPLTQQSSARAEPASQCSTVPTASTLSSNFMYKVGWEPNWFSISGDGGKTCEMGEGQRVNDFKTSSHCGARAPGWNWSSLKTRQTAAVCFQVEVVLLSVALQLCTLLAQLLAAVLAQVGFALLHR